LKLLLKAKLVHHENVAYDGYRLTYLGYDYLAIKTLFKRGRISSVGPQIGVGKEADVFEVKNEEGEVMALKLHRLGRTSFRAVKSKRDYLKHRNSFSWLYLSRLAALKEFAFMAALDRHGCPVPKAIDNSRHAVLMSLIDAAPLAQIRVLEDPGAVFRQCVDLVARLAALGLIHCDFNEFNLLIDSNEHLTLIDFPQMVSVGHGNARELFYRDVECIIRFFKKKIGYIPENDVSNVFDRPDFEAILSRLEENIGPELKASGFEREHQVTLEQWAAQQDPAEFPPHHQILERHGSGTCDSAGALVPSMGNVNVPPDILDASKDEDAAAVSMSTRDKAPSQTAIHERVQSELRRSLVVDRARLKLQKSGRKQQNKFVDS